MPSRFIDLPRYKESITAQAFGEVLGYVKSFGIEPQKHFVYRKRQTFEVTRHFLMIDQVNPDIVINFVANALDMSFQYAVVQRGKDGADDTVLVHPDSNKLTSLRYKISSDTDADFTDGSQKAIDDLMKQFRADFEKHMKPHINK